MDCIFCKIIDGEIPSYKVYENENILAFLDITPKTYGHTLVIPKQHFRDLLELDNCKVNYLAEVTKVANFMKEKLNYDGINLINNCGKVAGQEVFHLHFHLIPQYEDIKINEQKNDFTTICSKINS